MTPNHNERIMKQRFINKYFLTQQSDTNLLCCGDNLEQLLDTLEKELNRMKIWFDENMINGIELESI